MRYLLLLAALTGCSAASGYEPDQTPINAFVSDQIAYHEPRPAKTKPDPQKGCKCEGTGMVMSGDKISWVTCQCGEGCKCEKPSRSSVNAEPVAEHRMLMFTALWCPPCREWMNKVSPDLKGQGWDISHDADAHIQMIDSDTQPKIFFQYRIASMPTFIMVDRSGREVARHSGNDMSAIETAEFFYSNQQLPRSSYPPPVGVDVEPSQQATEPEVQLPPQQQGIVTRRSKLISRGCRGGRCR